MKWKPHGAAIASAGAVSPALSSSKVPPITCSGVANDISPVRAIKFGQPNPVAVPEDAYCQAAGGEIRGNGAGRHPGSIRRGRDVDHLTLDEVWHGQTRHADGLRLD
jgi:hypothetical protein